MSFISILKKVGSVALGVEKVVSATGLGSAIPGFALIDSVLQRIPNAIIRGEIGNPADGQGGIKSEVVTADFNEGLDFTQQILALKGEKLSYDAALLQESINSQVAALNAMAKLKASFKVVPL